MDLNDLKGEYLRRGRSGFWVCEDTVRVSLLEDRRGLVDVKFSIAGFKCHELFIM